MNISSELLQQLAAIGFSALDRGYVTEIQQISQALRAARPDNEASYHLQAFVYLQQGKVQDAIKTMREQALPRAADKLSVRTMLINLLCQTGHRAEAEVELLAMRELYGDACADRVQQLERQFGLGTGSHTSIALS